MMTQGFKSEIKIILAREEAGAPFEPERYEEKGRDRLAASHNKQRRLNNHKSRRALLRLELQRRRREGGLRADKFSSLEEVSRSIATSLISFKQLKKGQVLEKHSLNGNTGITKEPKAGQRYFGLEKRLEDATVIGDRTSYKKNLQDPPAVLLPSGLHFGTPQIINQSQRQLSHTENLSPKESDCTSKTSSNESENKSEGDLWIGADISSEYWHWYNKSLGWFSRRQYTQLCLVWAILTLAVVLTFIFAKAKDDDTYNGEIGNIALAQLNGRHLPIRPLPELPPVFEQNSVPHIKHIRGSVDNDSLINIVQKFNTEDFSETSDTPHGKALRWMQRNKLGDMEIFRIEQRYILAVIYFHFQAETWNIEYGWLSSKHECTWYGVRCGSDGTYGIDTNSSLVELESQSSSGIENLAEIVTYLDLSENNLHGEFPKDLKYLTNLKTLILSRNFIQGSIQEDILSNFQSMHTLYLDQNYITGQVPDEFDRLLFLRNLDLHDNSLRGTIPATMEFASDLVDVRLQNNEFYGVIPEVFHATTNLRVFLAGNNELKGAIPTSLADSPHLVALYLHENELDGTIPEFISVGLRQLHLYGNDFRGSMPSLMAPSFSALEELRLENNSLSGDIPDGLGDQINVKVLQLQGNKFTGSVPESVCLLKTEHNLAYLTVACAGSLQELSCDCCDFC